MSQKQQQLLAAVCLTALCAMPTSGHAQCGSATNARRDSSLAHPLAGDPDSTGLAADATGTHRRRPATSRADPKLDAYRIAALDPRMPDAHNRVRKDQVGPLKVSKESCGEVADIPPGLIVTPSAGELPEIPTPTIPPASRLTPTPQRHGLFGGLLIGAVAAALLDHGGSGTITGGTIGTGTPGTPTLPPGGGGTTPPGGGGGGTPPTDTTATPGGGGSTPPGGGGTTPPGGGGTTPPGGGGTTPPGGGGTTPPGGGGTTPPGGGGATPPGGTSVPPTTTTPEPATIALVGGGLITLGWSRRMRR